jgi:hypothetical protein
MRRRGVGLFSRLERQQAVAVNRFEEDRNPMGGGGHHARQEEAGILVGDDYAGTRGERVQQSFTRTPFRFDIRVIADSTAIERAKIIPHAIQDKGVESLRGPRIIEPERFKNDERLLERDAVIDRVFQRGIPRGTPCGDHPIKDKIA